MAKQQTPVTTTSLANPPRADAAAALAARRLARAARVPRAPPQPVEAPVPGLAAAKAPRKRVDGENFATPALRNLIEYRVMLRHTPLAGARTRASWSRPPTWRAPGRRSRLRSPSGSRTPASLASAGSRTSTPGSPSSSRTGIPAEVTILPEDEHQARRREARARGRHGAGGHVRQAAGGPVPA